MKSESEEKTQLYFERAKEEIYHFYGLKLTLIEQIALKTICRDSFRRYKNDGLEFWHPYTKHKIKKGIKIKLWDLKWGGLNPASEALSRFMLDYYGIDHRQMLEIWKLKIRNDKEFHNHMQTLQDKLHKP